MEKIKYGMVGRGEGAFIAAVHRHAAQLDNRYQLVCGAFSSNPEDRIQCVISVTLNHLHFPVAIEALKHGFHVLSDNLATTSLVDCQQLADSVQRAWGCYGLMLPTLRRQKHAPE